MKERTVCSSFQFPLSILANVHREIFCLMNIRNLVVAGVSRGKGQDLFLHSFYESLHLIQEKKQQVPSVHALIVGSDMNAQTKFETELRNFVLEKKIQDRVHFVNKTLTVAPYLAAIDVLVQNSQVCSATSEFSLEATLCFYQCSCYFIFGKRTKRRY